MTSLEAARHALRQLTDPVRAQTQRGFFKNSADDIFLGVPAASVRKIAKGFAELPLTDIRRLMQSVTHEERSLAHTILCLQFRKADEGRQEKIFNFYIRNRRFIRDWDGVDDSAPYIAGPWLLARDKGILYELARSSRVWDRRIAIVSTWWFIRNGKVEDTFVLAEILLHDSEDLIQKATGWMLREAGKKNIVALERFLRRHHASMPRTTLRYAIERFPEQKRLRYMRARAAASRPSSGSRVPAAADLQPAVRPQGS
jgi:3-methyladenine DNA glycosylase AlkD